MKRPRIPETGRRTKHILIGLAVMAMLLITVVATQTLAVVKTGDAELDKANCSVAMAITGYKDGEPVAIPLANSPFTINNVEVDQIGISINWIVQGSGIDWSTFALSGKLEVDYLNAYDNWINEYTVSFGGTEKSGSYSKILTLGTDICKAENVVYGGWFLSIKAPMTVTADDEIGIPLSAEVLDPNGAILAGTVNVVWNSALGAEGGWDWNYY